jgi:hypothetical protein
MRGKEIVRSTSIIARQYEPSLVSSADLTFALLASIAAVSGQQIPFIPCIPNGVFFPRRIPNL